MHHWLLTALTLHPCSRTFASSSSACDIARRLVHMANSERPGLPEASRSRSPRVAAPVQVFARGPTADGSAPDELRVIELADVINASRCLQVPARRLTVPPPPPSRLRPANAALARVPPPPVPLPSAPHFMANLPEGADGTHQAILWSPSLVSWLPTTLDPHTAATRPDSKAYTLAMRGPLMANGEHFLVPIPPTSWCGHAPRTPVRRPRGPTWIGPPPPPAPMTVEEPDLPSPLPRRQGASVEAPHTGKITAPVPLEAMPVPQPIALEDAPASPLVPRRPVPVPDGAAASSASLTGVPAEEVRQQLGFPAVPPGMPSFSVPATALADAQPARAEGESTVALPLRHLTAQDPVPPATVDSAQPPTASDAPPPVRTRSCSPTSRVSSTEAREVQVYASPSFQADWGDSDDEWGDWRPRQRTSRQTSGASSDPLGAFMPSVDCGPKQSQTRPPPPPVRKSTASAPPCIPAWRGPPPPKALEEDLPRGPVLTTRQLSARQDRARRRSRH